MKKPRPRAVIFNDGGLGFSRHLPDLPTLTRWIQLKEGQTLRRALHSRENIRLDDRMAPNDYSLLSLSVAFSPSFLPSFLPSLWSS